MDEMIKTEEGDDSYMGDWSRQPFNLLLKVPQSNGKPLPIGRFTGKVEQCHKFYMKLLGWSPRSDYECSGSSNGIRGGNIYNGCFEGDTWVVPLGWTIH